MSPIRRLEVSVNQQTKGLTVESIAIPISLTLELQPEGADIGSLERAVSAGLADVARQLWAELISTLERSLVVGRGHVGCGGIVKANGRAARRIVTLAGEVGLSRRRYRCGACGTEIVPLDELLGLAPRAQHTLGVRERALWLVTELSYAKAARTLDELRAIGVSHGQVHGWVQEEGARIEADVAARTEALFGAHPERTGSGAMPGDVWVSADGTMVNDRHSGTHMEVKLGLVFTGTERTGKDRHRLLDRHLVGATGSWTTFAERFTAACAAMGVYEAERILFVSDGAAAIRWIRERSFPEAIELLDWYHLTEQLRLGSAGSTRPSSPPRSVPRGPGMSRRSWPSCAVTLARSRSMTPSRRSAVGCHRLCHQQPARHRQLPHRAPGQLGADGEGRRHHHLPTLQDPRHELVPSWREPSAPSQAAAPQRHLGSLLGRAALRGAPSLAEHGVSVSTGT